MVQVCVASGEEFSVSAEEVQFYQALGLPKPKLSPIERQRRRMAYRNFRHLTLTKCAVSGERILSMYPETVSFPVVSSSYWWSDAWDARDFGRAYTSNQDFYDQYRNLSSCVPRYGVMNVAAEKCEYSNFALNSSRCYLVFGCVRNENCLYGHIVWDCESCVDTLYAYRSQWCSNSTDIVRCYDIHYSQECTDCSESYFLFDCAGCSNCFGCWNLRGARYCLFNEQLSRADYEARLKTIFPIEAGTVSYAEVESIGQQVRCYLLEHGVCPEIFQTGSENISGNHIYESGNLKYCFDAKRCEESSYCFTACDVVQSMDISFTAASARSCYECLTVGNCERVMFSHMLNDCSDSLYSEFCFGCQEIIGCVGLRKARYAILNREYPREEYFRLKEEIIANLSQSGRWGEFFPIEDSPFAYNKSIAQEYLPLSSAECESRGLNWDKRDSENSCPSESESPPPTIAEATEEILEQRFICREQGKAYKIIKAELDFYRRMKLPLSPYSPEARHLRRMAERGTRTLESLHCGECSKPLSASRPGNGFPRVVCLSCYQNTK